MRSEQACVGYDIRFDSDLTFQIQHAVLVELGVSVNWFQFTWKICGVLDTASVLGYVLAVTSIVHCMVFLAVPSSLTMKQAPKQAPNDQDVLFGRGNFAKFHPGNFRYRKLVSQSKSAWKRAISREEKICIARKIIGAINNAYPPGRFVKFDKDSKVWKEVTMTEALNKTQKALREVSVAEEPPEEEQKGKTNDKVRYAFMLSIFFFT